MPIPNPLHVVARVLMRHDYRLLVQTRGYQKEAFDSLREAFAAHYMTLAGCDFQRYISPVWHAFNARLERTLLPSPPFTFLNDPMIIKTMSVSVGSRWLQHQLALLEARLHHQALRVSLHEDYVGIPLMARTPYLTSHNTIHHLYHLVRYADATGCALNELVTIVEWGGGYGNLAKIFRRFHGGEHTYVIIDLPLLSCLQWLYLATIFGVEEVVLILEPDRPIQPGKINILPVCYIDEVSISADLFVSTWALSESSFKAMDDVVARAWFGARRLLLAYQKNSKLHPHAERVGALAAARGAVIEAIEFLPGSFYASL